MKPVGVMVWVRTLGEDVKDACGDQSSPTPHLPGKGWTHHVQRLAHGKTV